MKEKILEIIKEMDFKIENVFLDGDFSFYQIGMDDLDISELIFNIEKVLKVKISDTEEREILGNPTLNNTVSIFSNR